MDDDTKLIEWAINLLPNYNRKIISYTWTKDLNFELSDFSFHFNIGGINYEGRGMSEKPSTALVKSISEALERTVIESYNLNSSNGVASHFCHEKALENSICELIERDLFLCTYICKNAGVKIINFLNLSLYNTKLVNFFKDQNIEIILYDLGSIDERKVTLAIANGFSLTNRFGCIVGLGCAKDQQVSIQKSLLETIQNVASQIQKKSCIFWSKDLSDFFSENSYLKQMDHTNLALSEKYGRWLWDYYKRKSLLPIYTEERSLQDLGIHSKDLQIQVNNPGLCTVHSSSENLMELFFDKTNLKKLNARRLKNFLNCEVSIDLINLLPHPLS